MKILEKFGDFVKGIFNEAQRAWNKLEPEEQNALEYGSKIVDIINKNLSVAPKEVIDLIQKQIPVINVEKLSQILSTLSADLKIAENSSTPDLYSSVANLQIFLSGLKGKFWEAASSILAQGLAIILAPEQTAFAKISLLAEFVYHKIVKK